MASRKYSMEEFIQMEDNTLKPLLSGDLEELKPLVSEVIFRCWQIYIILDIFNREMAEKPLIRA